VGLRLACGGALHSAKVLRDCRLRKETPGTEPSAAARASWKTDMDQLVCKRKIDSAAAPAAQVKGLKRAAATPRLASDDFAMSVHNAHVQGWRKEGFALWVPTDKERLWNDELQHGLKSTLLITSISYFACRGSRRNPIANLEASMRKQAGFLIEGLK
jgi:hypothetical protein